MKDSVAELGEPARFGLSTYALFWEISSRNPEPLSLEAMVQRAAEVGCDVLQICDHAPLEQRTTRELATLARDASEMGVELEVGTRGVETDHLTRYLEICDSLGAGLLRSMVPAGTDDRSLDAARTCLEKILPALERAGVSLALETYEQLATPELVALVTGLDSACAGIALDPANCVANFELPDEVIDRCAARTVNLHVKDFAFRRQEGWVGFTYAGAPMGEGRLDYSHELRAVRPVERRITQVIEHWLPWQGDITTTINEERRWTDQAVSYMKENQK